MRTSSAHSRRTIRSAIASAALGAAALSAVAPAPGAVPRPEPFGAPIETDTESAARIYLIGRDDRPADNIYGEQPYGDASGRRIAIRYHKTRERAGGIEIVDLHDGTRHVVLSGDPPFPAFHAWGEWLYYAERTAAGQILRRCNYLTLEKQDVAPLPTERGRYSYGTVSPDHSYYAVSVYPAQDAPAQVHVLDLIKGRWNVLLDKPGYHAKHEQFSRDGRNRVLIQLNKMPDVKSVLLAEIEIGGCARLFPADRPHTPRPTGHEAWIGDTNAIFFSTGVDRNSKGNVWSAAVGDANPRLVHKGARFGHVSVSRDGRYWIGDTGEKCVPIYIGTFSTGRCRRACFSRTEYDGKQWSHAHPYLTADNRWLIFSARRAGHPQVYGARIARAWLDTLLDAP